MLFRVVGIALLALWVGLVFPSARARPGTQEDDPEPSALERFEASCDSDNPYLVTPCYVMSNDTAEPALVAFHASADARSEHVVLATARQIGATWGLAWDGRAVYAAAFHKRAAPFGPGGPGMIYRVDVATGEVEPWLEVADAGLDGHGVTDGGDFDLQGADLAGRTSLGDIDLDDGGGTLFVMNLQQRRILRYRVVDRMLLSSFEHGAAGETWAAAEARPFALKWWRGRLYHGVVRDASMSGERADLAAYVYSSRADGSDMRQVLELPLDYVWQGPHYEVPGQWMPWHGDHRETLDGRMFIWPQPWLTDLEFSAEGDMLLGLRDRQGDTTLFGLSGLPPDEKNGQQGGDTLIARREGDVWRFTDDPEFFGQDASRSVGATWDGHPETGFGGLARLSRPHQLVVTALSPLRYSSGGAMWFDIETGANPRREEIYAMQGNVNFGKANGLGDAELLCRPPREPASIYLSWVARRAPCTPKVSRADVALVLDLSTSMYRPTRAGRTKHAAALEAAARFVDLLRLDAPNGDRVAVIGFNDEAWIEAPLGGSRAPALAALERLPARIQQGTRLDLALERGAEALAGAPRTGGRQPVLVLLTDGLPNRVPFPPGGRQEDTVLAAAEAAKAGGIALYTVGLGAEDDLLRWLLQRAASEPSMYLQAPDGEDLAAVYREIAGRVVGCP
jgi:Mg-chelatase subunit ChlD